jgi:hypothetical protein
MDAKQFLGYFFFCSMAFTAWSQDRKDPGARPQESFSYLMPGMAYVSDAVFMGRRDSVAAPYLMPSLGYYHRSGLYGEASLSYLLASGEGRVDLYLLTGGDAFEKGKLSGNFSGTAYFFNESSYNVKSQTSGDLTAQLAYDLGWFEIGLGLSSYFNQEGGPDFFLGSSVRRTLSTLDGRLILQPGISAYAGTQRFYQAYYSNSRLGNRKSSGQRAGGNAATNPVEVTLQEVESFRLLNVELDLPIHYFSGHFIFSLYPSVALPQSPSTITTGTGTFEEELDPAFYLIAGISFWLN